MTRHYHSNCKNSTDHNASFAYSFYMSDYLHNFLSILHCLIGNYTLSLPSTQKISKNKIDKTDLVFLRSFIHVCMYKSSMSIFCNPKIIEKVYEKNLCFYDYASSSSDKERKSVCL